MSIRLTVVFMAVLAVFVIPTAAASQDLTDPYEILNNHFRSMGGLDRLKAEQTYTFDGNISVAGLSGSIKVWVHKPDRSRVEVDLGILKIIQGDNGDYEWNVDSNGKLQKITEPDEAARKREQVTRLMTLYEYADPNSEVFSVIFRRLEKVDTSDCYVVDIGNNINRDIHTYYFDTDSYLLVKSQVFEGEDRRETLYYDYREVEGLMVAFRHQETALQTGQVEIVEIAEYVSNPVIDPTVFDAPAEGAKDYRFVEGNAAENIPFRFVENHLYIPVTVECQRKYWILDTGAGMSVISEKFASELGLELQGDMKGLGAGGTVNIKLTTLPPYSLKGIEFDEQMVAVVNLEELNRVLGIQVSGILGYDFLSRFVTKIDYANELVSFYDPDKFEYSGDGKDVKMHLQNGTFVVEAELDGQYSGTWLLDIGAGSVSVNGGFAVRTGLAEKKGAERLSRGAANAFRTKSIKCNKIGFAGFTIDNPKVMFSCGSGDTVSTSDEIGSLGNTLLRNFVVYCDYANERLIMEKGSNFNQEFPEDRSGLQLRRGDDGVEVVFVSPDTPADKAGLRTGDVLRQINGIDVAHFDGLIAIREMLTEERGTEYTLDVDRSGESKRMKLRLASLY